MGDRTLLVNGFYASPVGHAVEMLHRALGYHLADPGCRVSVLLNADTPTELGGLAPFVASTWPVRHPFVDAPPEAASSDRALAGVPATWDVVVDDHRRAQAWQRERFAGLAAFYAASDRHLRARRLRVLPGDPRVPYEPGGRLRLDVPGPSRAAARRRLADAEGRAVVVVVPSGSSERSRYPSARSWSAVLDRLHRLEPAPRLVLLGKAVRDGRTSSTLLPGERERLLAHPARPVDAFDLPFLEQLALLEAADVLVAPHTGLGLAALAVGTPWLAISGGPWFEWFFNRVPFRSVLPDTARFPSFAPTTPLVEDDGPRQPSMSFARIEEDLDRIAAAASELIAGEVDDERAMREYVPALLHALGGDASRIFSNDMLHEAYLPDGR